MPRAARVVAAGAPHHVTQGGNNRQRTFPSQEDDQADLALLAEWARQYECRLLGYCLMPNHMHLAVIPGRGGALELELGRAHNAYSRYLNDRLFSARR